MAEVPERIDWATGDMLGLEIPAHPDALRAGGVEFLTRAFRAAGTISGDNEITAITKFRDCPGGSTGRKLFLGVDYARDEPGTAKALFVKFSRDFDNAIRDRGKEEMESEVRFAAVSRTPGFPIAVPLYHFGDYEAASGTGILITDRVAFGVDGVEPHYDKCLDYRIADPLEHYQALVRANGRLAGAFKGGKLPQEFVDHFPFKAETQSGWPIRYDARQLRNRVARYKQFAEEFPQLLPANIRDEAFIAKLHDEVGLFLEAEGAIKRFLAASPDLVALCHWNPNIDNAWFWRDASGELQCGLLDWGHVNTMNVALALWGGLSAAELEIWDNHVPDLLALFVDEIVGQGGPRLDPAELRLHLNLFVAMLGLTWLLDCPPMIRKVVPDLAEATGPRDRRFEENETARTQLHMLTVFLNLWHRQDFGAMLERVRPRL